jgi:indole-3-glycerol phosphate synthase
MLDELLALGRSLKMEPLVEVHSRQELDCVLAAGANIIGVNNRDLQDLTVNLKTSFDLIRAIPEECTAVSESGLSTSGDIARLRDAGFDAFLIGEHLMQQDDPAQTLIDLIGSRDADNLAG